MLPRVSHAKPLRRADNAFICLSRYLSSSERLPDPRLRNVEELANMGNILTKAIRHSDTNPGWNHSTRRWGKKTNSAPPPDVRWKFPSIERKQFSLEPHLRDTPLDEAIQASSSAASLQPGCFVEMRRSVWYKHLSIFFLNFRVFSHETVRHGVVLASLTINQVPVVTTLLTTGEVLDIPEADVMFTIPQFVDADLTKRCGTTTEINAFKLAARQLVVKRAREFERAVEEVYNGMSWEANALYSKLKAQNGDEWAEISTIEAARILHVAPNPPIITLFAVHKHLMNQGDKYVAQAASHRQKNMFSIRPRSHVAQLKNVRKWIHEGHPLLDSFTKKARTLIDKARELARESTDGLHLEPVPAGLKFNPSEKEIIKLLQLSLDEFRTTQVSPYAALVPSIIKKFDRYEGEINHWTILTTLRELGVHEPWEDMVSKNRDFVHVRGARTLADHTEEDAGHLIRNDPHESVRHDFGQLPVFVVDDYEAEELDDGLSFEMDPHDPSLQWIHVHVADPTSILSPTHPIALQARKVMASTYFIYDTWPMLPPSVGHTGLRRSSGDGQGVPQNVLTFSVKLNSEGNILDYKVRPGVVRNVTIMKYDDVDAALGISGFEPTKPFETSANPSNPSYILPHLESLRRLWEATEKQVSSHLQLPIFSYSRPSAQVSMSPKPGPLRLAG